MARDYEYAASGLCGKTAPVGGNTGFITTSTNTHTFFSHLILKNANLLVDLVICLGWWNTYPVPFYRSVRVTVRADDAADGRGCQVMHRPLIDVAPRAAATPCRTCSVATLKTCCACQMVLLLLLLLLVVVGVVVVLAWNLCSTRLRAVMCSKQCHDVRPFKHMCRRVRLRPAVRIVLYAMLYTILYTIHYALYLYTVL